MDGDDVPPTEMRWIRPHRDEIDAVLGDEQLLDDDLIDVAAIVHDLRSVYLTDDRLPRHAALAAFTGARLDGALLDGALLDDKGEPLVTAASNAHGSAPQTAGLPNRAPDSEGRRSMFRALTAITATVAGKIALGTAVAAASVGGLVAAGVEVPGLPEQAADQAVVATQDAGPEEGEDTSAMPSELALEMQAWTACVADAGAARGEAMSDHDASVSGPPGRFDPEEACGERPSNPAADGAQGPPEEVQAFVAAVRAWADCVAENAPDHAAACTKPAAPGGGAADGDDGLDGEGQPEGTPDGPPEGTPDGPPEGTPDGPPEGTSELPPEGDTPDGAPEGTPDGPPSGIPGAP